VVFVHICPSENNIEPCMKMFLSILLIAFLHISIYNDSCIVETEKEPCLLLPCK
jgi:hypothetical protein